MDLNLAVKEEEEAFLQARQIQQVRDFSTVLNTALDHGLIQTMVEVAGGGDGGGYLTPSQLAALLKLEKNPDAPIMLDHMLCFLASYSVVRCMADPAGCHQRLYAAAPVCKFLMKQRIEEPKFYPLFGLAGKAWDHLKDSVVEGGVPFDKAHGMNFYEHLRNNPTLGKLFDQLMCDQALAIQQAILQTYQGFEGINTLVDIGGVSKWILEH